MATMTFARGGPAIDRATVLVGVPELPSCFDPDQYATRKDSPSSGDVHIQLFDPLLRYPLIERDGALIQDVTRFEGLLAERFEASDDHRRYTVHLRPGATSFYGNELTAEDVVWSWEALRSPKGAPAPPDTHWLATGVPGEVGRWVSFMGSAPAGFDGIRALDRYVVEFALAEPNLLFPHILAMVVPPIYDSAEAAEHATSDDPFARRWLATNPGGFGRYRIESRSEDELVLVARPEHWDGLPAIRRVVYRVLPRGRDRLEALIAGETDVVSRPLPAEAERAEATEGLELFRAPGDSRLSMQMDVRSPPFDELAVRRALALAIPYDAIVDEVLHGYGRRWHGVVPDTSTAYVDTLEDVEYDPERARHELAIAGRERVAATILCGQSPIQVQAAQRIADAAAKAGFELAVEPLDSTELSRRQTSFDVPLLLGGGEHRCGEESYAIPHDFGDRHFGITNWIDYSNAAVDDLIVRIRQTADPVRRRALIEDSQRLVAADLPWAFIAQPDFLIAHRAQLSGFSWRSRSGGLPAYCELSWAGS